ncbi:hypothetical protein F5884DRAFT_668042 [Xylogone sp. PMI_703]|nr:hypothetical protein F5884DRAFT_668042 [Xylogone sp. PMI_703]
MPCTTKDRSSTLPDLSGRVYVVTGGNAGIGQQTVFQLAQKNARVYIGCRSTEKGDAAIKSIRQQLPTADLHILVLDHMDLSSVVRAANELKQKETRLHGLINNAGIMAVPFEISKKDGYESQWQTNYLAHWLLTYHLLPLLLSTSKEEQETGSVRLVDVTSMGHAMAKGIDFDDINLTKKNSFSRYSMSKLGNILHAKYLNTLYGPTGTQKDQAGEIWTAAVHPGNVYTNLNFNASGMIPFPKLFARTLKMLGAYIPVEDAAYSPVFCAASKEFRKEMSGEYFVPVAKTAKPSAPATNAELAKKLWEWTVEEMRKKGFI